jgi:N-acetylmuramoyl-L-alanine amidase
VTRRRLAAHLPGAILLLAASLCLAPGSALAEDAALPLAGRVIVLDPGHNGGNASHLDEISQRVWIGNGWKPCNRVGTETRAGYPEHRLNWAVARRVKARLEELGATVHLTRTSDTGVGPCVDVRGQLGAAVGADLAVSIHADGSRAGNRGFFVMRPGLVEGWTDDIRGRSARLARALRDGLAARHLPVANYYATNGLKVRTDLGTLNHSDVPIAMVELGNMRNRRDAERMTSARGKDRYAAGIVSGIRRYLGR